MSIPSMFERPVTLQENQMYFLKISGENGNIPIFRQVKFMSYIACPAVVIVQDPRYGSFPCNREDLFCVVIESHQRNLRAIV